VIVLGAPLPVILERMAASPMDVQIAIEGAYALVEQTEGGDEACDAIIEGGGHIQLLSVIAAFLDNEELCEQASRALYCIADGEGNPRSSALVAAGAVPIFAAIAHTHDGRAKTSAIETLKKIRLPSDRTSKVSPPPLAHCDKHNTGHRRQDGWVGGSG
jgi:hypothetical protein